MVEGRSVVQSGVAWGYCLSALKGEPNHKVSSTIQTFFTNHYLPLYLQLFLMYLLNGNVAYGFKWGCIWKSLRSYRPFLSALSPPGIESVTSWNDHCFKLPDNRSRNSVILDPSIHFTLLQSIVAAYISLYLNLLYFMFLKNNTSK